jgi:serine phosphatase RsbU (regulator of sigma subunit)
VLGGSGVALGIEDDWDYEESEIGIDSGQIILIGTIVRDHAAMTAKDLLKEIFDALNRFRYPAERKDDETLVVIKVK